MLRYKDAARMPHIILVASAVPELWTAGCTCQLSGNKADNWMGRGDHPADQASLSLGTVTAAASL
jgi:hypothetical protein